jgi:hypothetical protein
MVELENKSRGFMVEVVLCIDSNGEIKFNIGGGGEGPYGPL